MDDLVTVLRGDALALPLEDASVDLVVTSPPYFHLREYMDDGSGYDGQIGREVTARDYVDALIAATSEIFRVLKPEGSAWVNLGDRYVSGGLVGTPWRYAIEASERLGVTIRQEIIWDKEKSFIDARSRGRFRRAHETWFHLTRGTKHFADVDVLRSAPASSYTQRPQYRRAMELFAAAGLTDEHRAATRSVGVVDSAGGEVRSGGSWDSQAGRLASEVRDALGSYYRELCGNPESLAGVLPSSVQRVAPYPLKVPKSLGLPGHFAAFPIEWPLRLVAAYSPPEGVVLDPFGGTGTTALAASVLGRRGVSVDLSGDYSRVATWRTTDPVQRARATDTALALALL